MQKLALMMAVMILGMSPAHGCSISADPGSQGGRDQAELTLLPSTWSGDGGKAQMTEDIISLTTAKGGPPVEPGGHPIGRILQQIQLGVEGLVRIRNEILSTEARNSQRETRSQRVQSRLGGERSGEQTQERGCSEGDGRSEEGCRRDQGQRP